MLHGGIIATTNCISHVPILISNNPAPIDTSGYEPDKKLLTWMRALKVVPDEWQSR